MQQQPEKSRKIVVLADYQNVPLVKRRRNINGRAIVSFVERLGNICLLLAYNHWRALGIENERLLTTEGWTCIDVPFTEKNAVDKHLIQDYQRSFQHMSPDIVVLISGDGDYAPLVRSLRKEGIRVVVIGWQGYVNHRLLRLLPDDVYFVQDLRGLHSVTV